MNNKNRIQALEKKRGWKRTRTIYVVYDDRDQVLATPGGYMTKAEFEQAVKDTDVILTVRYVGADLSQI